ncbi:MAG TPA: aminoacyl-histidine dipeptidase [bacterium]|nr:aminoacyl-histidine dipeptidase [bacterium]HPN44449.1 aminoacyl-histidine dipeptidase [bacterium]
MSVLTGLEPALLWKYFDKIRQIPRSSGKEEAIADYVISVAKQFGLQFEKDKTGNVLIRKPASPGHEKAKTVVLQSHLDMVCEKNSDKKFDFDKDPIQLKMDGEWLKADGTTLGADNGIGIATALAILEDNKLVHGPIEALFTIDEERGLVGAMSISPTWLKGRIMLNLDSEDLGLFSIGCAGGSDSHIKLPIKRIKASGNQQVEVHLSGLLGGHSGVNIHEGRGNALKIINRLIYQANKEIPLGIVCFEGGDKHNAIPREAKVKIMIDSKKLAALKKWFTKTMEDIRIEFKPVEQAIGLTVNEIPGVEEVLAPDTQKTLLSLLFALPHGPLAMSRDIKNLVETSNNVASIRCEKEQIKIHCSSRSSNGAALKATLDKIAAIAQLAGAALDQPPGYPGWMPNLESAILKVSLDTFKQVTGKEARYEAIHAGLECGLIGEKFSGMDMISLGPTIKYPHSPDERVNVPSVNVFYQHTIKILETLA